MALSLFCIPYYPYKLPGMENNVRITQFSEIQYEIINEIAVAMHKLGGKSDLVSTVMSWGDTLPDEDVFDLLKQWNDEPVISPRILARLQHH
jgi:hypothetical protein